MDETELRSLATTATALLELLIPDGEERRSVAIGLATALTLPEGKAQLALLRALSSHPALRAWIREQVAWSDRNYLGQSLTRHLSVDLPERVATGFAFGVHVQITVHAPGGTQSGALRPLDIPPAGAALTITISAPGLLPRGHLEQQVHVPAAGDSDPLLFPFTAVRPGRHTVVARAYRDGSFVGEVSAHVSVENSTSTSEVPPRTAAMRTAAMHAGEVTLEVYTTHEGLHCCRLIGLGVDPVEQADRVLREPRDGLTQVLHELSLQAEGISRLQEGGPRLERLRNHGVGMWRTALPEALRREFWNLKSTGRITTLSVASDVDVVPWELLYPVDQDQYDGFLVQQLPVLRRVLGQDRVPTLTLGSAAYVVPPDSPSSALDEVSDVRARLGAGVLNMEVVQHRNQLMALLEHPPNLLHFSCHNEFTDETGSVVWMGDEPFDPKDLHFVAARRTLARQAPLVFFNACRSAGEVADFTRPLGWAAQFMSAGAGAFVGSLWKVRDTAARAFADTFYDSFVTGGQSLGAAAQHARTANMDQEGDPTWLAYTVYGDPTTRVLTPGMGGDAPVQSTQAG